MISVYPIELLSPAKDLTCGVEAIRHGADAVYIGAPRFGARAAAGNTVDDIRRLCDFAHPFNARIYVALNTILKDNELKDAERMIHQLYRAGADALIIQDMGITRLDLPPIPLHASTQADIATPEKARFLCETGFARLILARELTLDEMVTIHRQTPVELEAFVHGALCVSYSGRCYLSAALSGRSANRGECAQPCRLPYTLSDANGQTVAAGKHPLSLKDLNRADELENMMQAGISAFKIEGRLKDTSYVKNITAFYRKKLDALFARNRTFCRSSAGTATYTFEPQPEKSFNRGFTSFYLHGRTPDVTSFETPKSIGEPVGKVKNADAGSFTLTTKKRLHNGDGFIFKNSLGVWEGVRANRVEGSRIYPLKNHSLRPQTAVYRNFDKAFDDLLSKPSAERKLDVKLELRDTSFGLTLSATDETGAGAVVVRTCEKETARTNPYENIRAQLSKLGNTLFRADEIVVDMSRQWFIPSSLLAGMRRDAIDKLLQVKRIQYRRAAAGIDNPAAAYPERNLDCTANVANVEAAAFYRAHGVESIAPAYELKPQRGIPLMHTRHCLHYSLGWCPSHHSSTLPYKEPLYLVHGHTRLRLQFDCKACRMMVYDE
ncbi:MAG: U32 family peptidase [Tannerella sp.]|jgi:putative protease|nr:U32 family peptidase [Tannerella sp.]